jgi:hypothetical protein
MGWSMMMLRLLRRLLLGCSLEHHCLLRLQIRISSGSNDCVALETPKRCHLTRSVFVLFCVVGYVGPRSGGFRLRLQMTVGSDAATLSASSSACTEGVGTCCTQMDSAVTVARVSFPFWQTTTVRILLQQRCSTSLSPPQARPSLSRCVLSSHSSVSVYLLLCVPVERKLWDNGRSRIFCGLPSKPVAEGSIRAHDMKA